MDNHPNYPTATMHYAAEPHKVTATNKAGERFRAVLNASHTSTDVSGKTTTRYVVTLFEGEASRADFEAACREYYPRKVYGGINRKGDGMVDNTKRRPYASVNAHRAEPYSASLPNFTASPLTATEREWLGAGVTVGGNVRAVDGNGQPVAVGCPPGVGHVIGMAPGTGRVWVYWQGFGFADLDTKGLSMVTPGVRALVDAQKALL